MRNRISRSVITMILILAMAVMGGCASSGSEEEKTADNGAKEAEESGNESKKEEKKGMDIHAEIKEQALIEQDGVKITATGIGSDDEDAFYINIKAENDTENTFEMRGGCTLVNGIVMTDDLWVHDTIVPGETEFELTIENPVLKYLDLGEIGEIKIYSARLFEAEEYESEDGEKYYKLKEGAENNPFTRIEEITIQTSAYDEMKTALPQGEELYNENGVQVLRAELSEEAKEDGYLDMIILKNESSDSVFLGSYEGAVNDYALGVMGGNDLIRSSTTPQGGCAVEMPSAESWSSCLQNAMATEEEVEIESAECTISVQKLVLDEEYGIWSDEKIAEIPYSYTAE